MKILEIRTINVTGKENVQFIRIDPEDTSETLSKILIEIMNLSWLKNFDKDYIASSFEERAKITIQDIQTKFKACDNGKITSDAGEYVVSELARETLIKELDYLDIPLAELLGKKVSGNPGFDFHSQNKLTDTVIFGEAKYIANSSAYSSAIKQINKFIADKKDIKDIADLQPFCTGKALGRANNGEKGFVAAFSVKSTSSDRIISSITAMAEFNALTAYNELILVAVNL